MGIKISELTEEVAVTDNDLVAVVDNETATTKKSKLSNFFKWILNRANTWTKQQKIVSDGTNSPLVVRDSTDTTDLFSINPSTGCTVQGNGGDGYISIKSKQGFFYPRIELLADGAGAGYGVHIQAYGTSRLLMQGQGGLNCRFYSNGVAFFDDPNLYPSSIFTVSSTTKGVLLPRLTTTQRNAISTPATGLELWDSTANTKSYKKSGGWSYAGLITETEWDRFYIGVDINVTNGSSFNLLSYIAEADKNNAITDAFNPLVIASNNIKTVWTGSKQIHTIRLNFKIKTGNAQFYRVELRRFSDNSVVATKVVSRNADEPAQTIDFVTRTLSATDPYVTGGFYIAFVNNSGASCTVEDGFQLVIINQYQ